MTAALSANISHDDAFVGVTAGPDAICPYLAQIDSELVIVQSGAANVFVISRGAYGTTKVPHSAAASITPVQPAVVPVNNSTATPLSPLTWDGVTLAEPAGSQAAGPKVAFAADPADGTGAAFTVTAGDGISGKAGGDAAIKGGAGHAGSSRSAVTAKGAANDGTGAGISLVAGNAKTASAKAGGDVTITLGSKDGAGRAGQLLITNLPTADPHVVNALWANSGVVTVSAG